MFVVLFLFFDICVRKTHKKAIRQSRRSYRRYGGMMMTTIHMKLSSTRGEVGVKIVDKDEDKDLENYVDKNKYFMKDNSV